jgi:hypothetical protein
VDNIFFANSFISDGVDVGFKWDRVRRERLKSREWVWRWVRKSEMIFRLSGLEWVKRPNR